MKKTKLYSHIMWGGVFELTDDGLLVAIKQQPDDPTGLFTTLQETGNWLPGQNVLYGDDDLTGHFVEVPNETL